MFMFIFGLIGQVWFLVIFGYFIQRQHIEKRHYFFNFSQERMFTLIDFRNRVISITNALASISIKKKVDFS